METNFDAAFSAALSAATPKNSLMIASCPRTLRALRAATPEETAAYSAANAPKRAQFRGSKAFDRPVVVADVLVDEWTGYGVAHAGAGF